MDYSRFFNPINIFIYVLNVLFIIDIVRNAKKDKTLWVIAVLLLGPIGYVLYRFSLRTKKLN